MVWNWRKKPPPEVRASYTDTLVNALITAAAGADDAVADNTAVADYAAGMIGRLLSAATITGGGPIAAGMLADIGQALTLKGEAVWHIRYPRLARASGWDITGGPDDWQYALTLPGPGNDLQLTAPARQVLHFRVNARQASPWKGRSPLSSLSTTAKLLAGLDLRLSQEAAARVGQLLPIPAAGQGTESDKIRKDMATLSGQTALVPTTASGWGQGAPPPTDWIARRFGANPPPQLADLRKQATRDVVAACGIPPVLWEGGEGAALREGYRQLLYTTLLPLAAVITAEVRSKLPLPMFSLDFNAIGATDIAGRARAYHSLTDAGMGPDEAKTLAGLG